MDIAMVKGTVAALAVMLQAAPALGQAVGGTVSKITVERADSVRRADVIMVRLLNPRIDSLVQRLDKLPIGSAEFAAVNDSLWAAIHALPTPTGFTAAGGGSFRMVVPTATPRAAVGMSPMDRIPQGWFGFLADGVTRDWYAPNGQYIQHLVYPTVVSIEPNSPASRAGVRSGDSVLAYNGMDLRAQPVNLTLLLTPGRDVSVKLRRDGELKDLTLTVEKAPPAVIEDRRTEAARMMVNSSAALQRREVELRAATVAGELTRAAPATGPQRAPLAVGGRSIYTIAPSVNGLMGAMMTNVDENLASSLRGMEGKRGILVTAVPPGSPAERTGLRNGDVILRADTHEVATAVELRVRMYNARATGVEKVKLTVLRAGKTQEIIVDSSR